MHPVLNVYPAQVMIDEPVHIWIENATPGEKLIIEAESDRYWSIPGIWRSRAVFQADALGRIDTAQHKSLDGSYTGVDPEGLFTSMQMVYAPRPYQQKKITDVARLHLEKISIRLKNANNELIGQAQIKRFALAENVLARNINSGDVVGRYFYSSERSNPHPAILVLGGNKLQMEDAQGYAALFAGMGMPALALSYHRLENLPAGINRVPVEIVEKAIEWLHSQEQVDSRLIGVFGCSRGAELALLSASLISDIRFVIAKSPSAYCFEGMDVNGLKTGCSSWTFRGEDIPFIPAPESIVRMAVRKIYCSAMKKQLTLPLFLRALSDKQIRNCSRIKVENINGPVLIISGQADKYWPSSRFAREIVNRLKENHHPYPVQNFDYPDAGHRIRIPYLPATYRTEGGTAEGNAAAAKDSWEQIRIFLKSILTVGSKLAPGTLAQEK